MLVAVWPMRSFNNMASLPEVFWRHWAFVLDMGVPVVVGEMGGTNEGKDNTWHTAALSYYRRRPIFTPCVIKVACPLDPLLFGTLALAGKKRSDSSTFASTRSPRTREAC